MDNQKFGRFIASLRHEKGWTQKDLAEKLNVTDKAVSKWERGQSFPDISLLEPLAETFDVSVIEIMQGEHIEENVAADHANESISDLINISEYQKMAERKNILIVAIAIVALISVIFLIDVGSIMGFLAVYLPVILLIMGVAFFAIGIFRKKKAKSGEQFFILGVISLIYPVGLYLLMLISVCMGLGPVAG